MDIGLQAVVVDTLVVLDQREADLVVLMLEQVMVEALQE